MSKFKKLLSAILIFLSLTAFAGDVHASDLTITCEPHDACDMAPTPGAPLFYEENMLPGDTIKRTITVINNSKENRCRNLSLTVVKTEESPADFADRLYTGMIKDTAPVFGTVSSGEAAPGFTMQSVFDTATFNMGEVGAGMTSTIDWYATFDKLAGNEFQLAKTKFDFSMYFECNSETLDSIIHIAKFNNSWPNTQSPGDSVLYTLEIWTDDSPVNGVTVSDLPPDGFRYRGGTWTANSNIRGDLKPGVTTEPAYASPGKWNLGDMQANEKVTLTYIADIDSGQYPGIYPDLAWAKGTYAGLLVYANAYDDPQYFVGTQVLVDKSLQSGTDRSASVLGTSTEVLPATGASTLSLLIAAGLSIVGTGLLILGIKNKKYEN